MLRSISDSLKSDTVNATDGEVGKVEDAYFDDQNWVLRYFVIETGSWLVSRQVLISPRSVIPPLGSGHIIDVSLTREQIKGSPDIDTHQPVSRQHERDYLGYYGYPLYWEGGGISPLDSIPILPLVPLTPEEEAAERAREATLAKSDDVHLRSTGKVKGYHIQATDDSIGHVEDYLFDDEDWTIRYLVIDTRNWWPGGKRVLVATSWIDHIDWAEMKVYTSLSRDAVKDSPEYHEPSDTNRDYEKRLHAAYSREGYWD
jgi:hypothetical protein